jgi:FkbM family methyltransferase
VRLLIGFCHRDQGGALRRLLAPVARKIAIRWCRLPMDLSVGGLNLRCNFVDNYSEKKFVFTPWRYDLEERLLLRGGLPADGVFVDIGANVGIYTITAGRSLGRSGRVIAFEPNPVTMERLKFNVSANFGDGPDRPEILLLNCGVADRDSEFELQVDRSNLGASSIARRSRSRVPSGMPRESVRVRCRPLLDVLAEVGARTVDVLKIDIEGAEDVALAPYLRDAPADLLARNIIIENSQELWSVDLHALMERRGYRLRFRNRMNSVYALNSGSSAIP